MRTAHHDGGDGASCGLWPANGLCVVRGAHPTRVVLAIMGGMTHHVQLGKINPMGWTAVGCALRTMMVGMAHPAGCGLPMGYVVRGAHPTGCGLPMGYGARCTPYGLWLANGLWCAVRTLHAD